MAEGKGYNENYFDSYSTSAGGAKFFNERMYGTEGTNLVPVAVNTEGELRTVSNTDNDDKLSLIIQLLLQKAADNPIWYDVAANALRTIVSGNVSVTGTLTGVTTVTTVTTVTGLTNIGGYPADQATINWMETDWGVTTRNLLM
jgi:hypothetical protein